MISAIHHVGVVVQRLSEAYRFYRDVLGLPLLAEAVLTDQGVRAALLGAMDAEIELLEPLDAGSGVGRFLARRGEGLHHVCFQTPDIDHELTVLEDRGVELVDAAPRPGLAGRIAFLHPRACAGVLVELATPAGHEPRPASPLELKRLVLGARDPGAMAGAFRALFAFPEVTMNDGPRRMLGVGSSALLIVPATEVGGIEGMVALSCVARDFAALVAACERSGTRVLRGTGEVTIAPESSHGVHLHVSRFRFP